MAVVCCGVCRQALELQGGGIIRDVRLAWHLWPLYILQHAVLTLLAGRLVSCSLFGASQAVICRHMLAGILHLTFLHMLQCCAAMLAQFEGPAHWASAFACCIAAATALCPLLQAMMQGVHASSFR